MSIKIIIADDHAITLEGLKTVIGRQDGRVEIVGEASNGEETLKLAEQVKADIYVLDIFMPGLNGIETAIELKHRDKNAKIIMLSMHSGQAMVEKAMRAGAHGYVLKDKGAEEIINAIYEVNSGRYYLSPEISGLMVNTMLGKGVDTKTSALGPLSSREREILRLIVLGMSGREIATKLGLSANTVHAHRNSIMRKLDLHKQTELVCYAVKEGIIQL